VAGIIGVVSLVFLIPLGIVLQRDNSSDALADAERRGGIVAGAVAVGADAKKVRAVAEAAGGQIFVHGVDTAPGTGASAAGATPSPARPAPHAAEADVSRAAAGREAVVTDVPGGVVRLEPVMIGKKVVVVEVFVPSAALGDPGRIWLLLLGVAAFLVIAGVVLADRLASPAVTSAHGLVKAAMAVGDGDLDVRVQPSGPRELAEAGYAFNRMADRLVASRTDERELVADLSHRLRTPLTALRLDADALDSDDTSIGGFSEAELDKRRTLRRIRQAIVTLEGEIDVLIKTTRKTISEQAGAAGLCDASEVVRERMGFWSQLAGDQNRPNKVVGAHTRIPVPVARAELAAALDAVIGNVFRYTPQGTAFEVAISRRDGYVAVRVDDAGPGIADPDRALRRGSSGRGSTGLGLDIAKRVATAASGSVNIDRAHLGGASIIMLLRDAEAAPRQVSRFGLVGRLAREPGAVRRWPRQRPSDD
jgi:signal transduction histidine kinase